MMRQEFMALMRFPHRWEELGMYPEELFQEQLKGYKPGHEEGAEHDRNGALHWWLRRDPDKSVLLKLVELCALDPDPLMAADVLSYIRRAKGCDADVVRAMPTAIE